MLVPKPVVQFCFSVDLQPINVFTLRHRCPMRNLEHELSGLNDGVYFANFEISHGYWKLLFTLLSRDCQYLITLNGIFTPTRVLHGTTNAATHLQSQLVGILREDVVSNFLIWLDHILLHTYTVK